MGSISAPSRWLDSENRRIGSFHLGTVVAELTFNVLDFSCAGSNGRLVRKVETHPRHSNVAGSDRACDQGNSNLCHRGRQADPVTAGVISSDANKWIKGRSAD